jgi:hypothetical protein
VLSRLSIAGVAQRGGRFDGLDPTRRVGESRTIGSVEGFQIRQLALARRIRRR